MIYNIINIFFFLKMSERQKIKNEELFIKYNHYIYLYEKFIEKIYGKDINSPARDKYKGYIMNLKDYEELKQNLNYTQVNKFYSSNNIEAQKCLQYYDANKFNKIKNIKLIEFNTPRYLVYKIMNGNDYIIISEELWNLINSNENININKNFLIEYSIESNNQISINFEKGENIFLWTNNNNIINKYSIQYGAKKEYLNYYIEEYKNIIKDINSYYNIEQEFFDNLNKKEKNSTPKSGYLISNSWINKWKRITNYNKIKIYIKSKKDSEIPNEVINHLEKNDYKYSELPPLEILSFKTKKEIDDYLANDIIAIIDNNFKASFKIKSTEKITIYNLNNNLINIIADKDMIFKLCKNIIATNENQNLFFLKQLFQIINLNLIDNKNIKDNNKIYLINKKVVDNYKRIFEYDKIYMNYFKKIDFIDAFNNIKDDYNLNKNNRDIKLVNNQIINFEYFSNFTLINEEDLLFLNEYSLINLLEKEKWTQCEYISKDNKILLILKDKENRYLYEIGYINSKGDFIIEYIIKEMENRQGNIRTFCKIHSINDLINYYLTKNNNNEIKSSDQLIGYYYEIQTIDESKDTNQILVNNSQEKIENNISDDENKNFLIKFLK